MVTWSAGILVLFLASSLSAQSKATVAHHEFRGTYEELTPAQKKLIDEWYADYNQMTHDHSQPTEYNQFSQSTRTTFEAVTHALAMFPGYPYALGALAKTRIQQHRYSDAVVLLQQRYQAAPHSENLFELAQALQLAGRLDEAQQAFTEFEQKSLLESARPDNSNHELVSYYVDYAHNPEKALAVAVREYAHRHDVFTLDCYAWALHATGQERMAREQIEAALAVGIRDSRLLYHDLGRPPSTHRQCCKVPADLLRLALARSFGPLCIGFPAPGGSRIWISATRCDHPPNCAEPPQEAEAAGTPQSVLVLVGSARRCCIAAES